ncbi:MAG: GAF domain-containing protein [Thermoplasmata archaeon]|nr:GAF domain-containing protein [Thermoplasmata archaeon]MCI4359122.1 GAF domain-containing protein [Thermoplasmata archaeon]
MPARQVVPALLQVDAVLLRLSGDDALAEVCRFLHREFSHFHWVGVYRLDGETLRLAGWAGDQATEHVSIPVGQGLCGLAARQNATVLVEDVSTRPEYLACFPDTRAEVVVPIRDGAAVIGEIDVDGRVVRAFDASDARFLEQVAAHIVGPTKAAGRAAAPV